MGRRGGAGPLSDRVYQLEAKPLVRLRPQHQPARIPDPALQYATIGGLAHAIRNTDNGQLDAYATYAERLTDEFTAVAMRDGCAANPRLATTPAVRQWAKDNRTLLGVN